MCLQVVTVMLEGCQEACPVECQAGCQVACQVGCQAEGRQAVDPQWKRWTELAPC